MMFLTLYSTQFYKIDVVSANVVGLRRVHAKVELNLNNRTGTWSDPNVESGYWSVATPVVKRRCWHSWFEPLPISILHNLRELYHEILIYSFFQGELIELYHMARSQVRLSIPYYCN